MDADRRTWILVGVAAVAGALAGAAVAWSVASSQMASVETELNDLRTRAAEASAAAELADERGSEIASLTARLESLAQDSDDAVPADEPEAEAAE